MNLIKTILVGTVLASALFAGGRTASADNRPAGIPPVDDSVAAPLGVSDYEPCYDRANTALTIAMQKALNRYLRDRAHPEIARNTLRQGIHEALDIYTNWKRLYKPLTVEALNRALELDGVFDSNCGEGQGADVCQPDRRALRFLFGYLEHVTRDIMPLDRTYFVPLHEHGCFDGRCDFGDNLWSAFITHYKEAALSLLKVYVGDGPDKEQPEALGNDTYELRVASKFFNWIAYDLQRDDFNRRFRCKIDGLQEMAQLLAAQLADSDDGVFFDDPQAVDNARAFARRLAWNMNSYRCERIF